MFENKYPASQTHLHWSFCCWEVCTLCCYRRNQNMHTMLSLPNNACNSLKLQRNVTAMCSVKYRLTERGEDHQTKSLTWLSRSGSPTGTAEFLCWRPWSCKFQGNNALACWDRFKWCSRGLCVLQNRKAACLELTMGCTSLRLQQDLRQASAHNGSGYKAG